MNNNGTSMHSIIDGMQKIHNFLIESGWIDLKYGEYLSKDKKFKIGVMYDQGSNKYCVRSAILAFYDRWANSGSEDEFDTYEDVIKFLKGRYIQAAYSEISDFVEDGFDSDGKLDDDVYRMILNAIDVLRK